MELKRNTISFENQYMKLWINDSILYCLYTPYLSITLDIAQTCVQDRIKFTEGKTYPMFSDIRKIKYIDRPSRIHFSKESSLSNISAESLLIGSQSEKLLYNLYIKINNPQIPTEQFSSEIEAIKWLQQFKGLKN